MRPADEDMIEKILPVPKRRGCPTPCRATLGSTRIGQEAEKVRGNVGESLYCGFCGKDQVRQGKQAYDW